MDRYLEIHEIKIDIRNNKLLSEHFKNKDLITINDLIDELDEAYYEIDRLNEKLEDKGSDYDDTRMCEAEEQRVLNGEDVESEEV